MRRRTSVWARLAAAITGIIVIAFAAIPTIGLVALFTLNSGTTPGASARTASAAPIGASATPRATATPAPTPSGLVAQPDDSPSPEPSEDPGGSPDPDASPSPTAASAPLKLNLGGKAAFVSQATDKWCASAAIQITVNLVISNPDTSTGFQRAIEESANQYTTRADSKNGGWGPTGMADAVSHYTGQQYELQILDTRAKALRAAARSIARTRLPVILLAWRGAHAWVMTGYKADGDPLGSEPWKVTGAYILDPWYPRVSNIWGRSKAPGAFHDLDDIGRNFLPWKRPEGSYPARDGKFLIIAPVAVDTEG